MLSPERPQAIVSHATNMRAALEMTVAAFGFATMSCIAHGLQDHVSWPVIALARIVLTLLLVVAALIWYRIPVSLRGTKPLWWRSLCGSVGLLCTFYAVTRLPVTDAVTIFATGPVWITLILVVVFRQRFPKRVWLYAFLALAGVYIMHRPAFDTGALPIAVALLGAIAAAAAMVSLSFCRHLKNLIIVGHFSACATVISIGACFLTDEPILLDSAVSPVIFLWLLPMGLAGTFAQIFMTAAYRRGTPTMIALVGISQIAFAALYDLALWGYRFDLWKWAGIAMIATAISLSILTTTGKRLG